MAVVTKAQLKTWYETGDKPTQQQFSDWIDTMAVQEDLDAPDFVSQFEDILN